MSRSVVPRHQMRNIVRYEHNGATSWVVRLIRRGRRYVKYFADGDQGSQASRRRAIAWRDDMERRLTPWNKLHRRSAPNQTGIIGVSVLNDPTRTGRIVRRWVAHWPSADGGRRKRSFSVLVYGERGARRRAIAARRRGIADLLCARSVQ